MKKFPTLFKQTSTGAIQQWQVSVKDNVVTTVYGQVDGKLQTTADIIREGKNLGRSNATTPETQAEAQAQQNYEAKLKEGYVTNIKLAASTKNTLEAVSPMLAYPIEKKMKYVSFPGLSQPKFDGLRMVCVMQDGKAKLWSRTQKEYLTLPHIIEEVEILFKGYPNIILDGEAYNHRYKKDFNKITSLIKRDDVHPDHKLVQFHIYDVVAEGDYLERTKPLRQILPKATYCIEVETVKVNSMGELEKYQADCIERGFEGCMYRNPKGAYENKRSVNLLKVKTFQDSEYKIVAVEEGAGKLMGKVGAFHCELNDGSGRTFKASPAVTLEEKEQMWFNKDFYIGKKATIQYQNLTPDKIPRFPIFKCVREDE